MLLFADEDTCARLQGICASARVPWNTLDIHVIADLDVRLDVPDDPARLLAEIERLPPRLIVLEPFVRLHRIDNNAATEVAPLLAYPREPQRTLCCAVALVHHARKGGHARAGQAQRGSSELHAWGDSNLYLRRDRSACCCRSSPARRRRCWVASSSSPIGAAGHAACPGRRRVRVEAGHVQLALA